MTAYAFTDCQQIEETAPYSYLDDGIINLKVSPRELKLMLDALIQSDRYMCQEGKLQSADLRRWDAILDYIKDRALEDAM